MRIQVVQLLVFLPVFAFSLLIQWGFHSFANNPLVWLLPGDGCGQVLDFQLQTLIKSALWLAYAAAFVTAFFYATVVAYKWGSTLFVLAALASIAAFVVGGVTNVRYSEHLTSCDVFYMGGEAPNLNFTAAGLLLFLVITVLYKARSK